MPLTPSAASPARLSTPRWIHHWQLRVTSRFLQAMTSKAISWMLRVPGSSQGNRCSPSDFHPIKLEGEQRLPCELPGTLNIHDMAFDVIACRNRDVTLNCQWRIQRGVESLPGLA